MTLVAVSKTFDPSDSGGYDIAGTYFPMSTAVVTNAFEVENVFATFSSNALDFAGSLMDAEITVSYTLSNHDYVQTQPIGVEIGTFDSTAQQDAIESNRTNSGNTQSLGSYGAEGSGNLTLVAGNYAVINQLYPEYETDIKGGTVSDSFQLTGPFATSPPYDAFVSFQAGDYPSDSGISSGYAGLTKVSNVTVTVTGLVYTNLPVISGTVSDQPMLDDDTIAPFTGVTLSDPSNPAGGGDIMRISITNASGMVDGSLGTLSLVGYPAGTLSDTGRGVYYLERSRSTADLQNQLDDLLFTPSSVTAAPSEVVTLALSYQALGGAQGTTIDTSTTIDVSHDQRTISVTGRPSGTDRTPFNALSGVSVSDPYDGDLVGTTITVQPGTGTLSGGGIVLNGNGTYSLAAASVDQLNSELQQVLFTATPGLSPPGSTSTAEIGIAAYSDDGLWTGNAAENAVVLAVAAPPTITGGNAIDVSNDRTARPFAGATISDDNDGSQESLLITLSNPAAGVLSGSGLNVNNDGSYALSGTAASVTSQLQALVFTPVAGAPNSATQTVFTLLDRTSVFTNATSSAFSVTDKDQPVMPTLTGGSNSTVQSEAASNPFASVVLNDPNVNSTDTLTIRLSSNAGRGGVLTGTGLTGGTNGTYTLTGSAGQVAAALQGLVFTPASGVPGSSTKSSFSLADSSSAGLTSRTLGLTVTDVDPTVAPILAGSSTGTVQSEATSTPFATATVLDPNAGSTDTLTITLSGAGGTLSGAGLTGGSGAYSLSGTAGQVTAALQALVFTPAAGLPNSAGTTGFTLADTTSSGTMASLAAFSVTDIDPAVAPTLLGAASISVQNEAAAKPFATAVLTDPNANSSDTLTIQLSSGGAGGALSGAGLNGGANGTYTLGGGAAQVTAALEALVFTPAPGAANSAVTTTFTLTDTTTAGTTAANTAFSVIDTDPVGTAGTLTATGTVFNPGNVSNMTIDATSAGSHTVVAGSGSKNLVRLGSGTATVSGSGTGDAILGGNGVTSVSGLGGGTSVTLGDGNDTVNLATAGAANVIATGNGNSHISAGNGGHEQVTAGNGANVISAGGAGDVVIAGNGGDAITLTGAGASVTTGSGNDSITVTGAGGAMIQAGLGLNKISFAGTGNMIVNQGGCCCSRCCCRC